MSEGCSGSSPDMIRAWAALQRSRGVGEYCRAVPSLLPAFALTRTHGQPCAAGAVKLEDTRREQPHVASLDGLVPVWGGGLAFSRLPLPSH